MKGLRLNWYSWKIDVGGLAVCVALTLATVFSGLRPVVAERRENALRRAALDEQMRRATEADEVLVALQARLETARIELASDSLRLKPVSSVNTTLAEISALAGDCGLKLNEIQPGRAVQGLHYQALPIQLAGTCTYRNGTLFLHRLRESAADVGVSGLELTGNPADPAGAGAFHLGLQWFAAPSADTATR